MEANITLDSPVPYRLDALLEGLKEKDTEMVPGARGEKQGPYNGKLTRFIQRLEAKQKDKRLNFMFSTEESLLSYTYMGELCEKLMAPSVNGEKGVKIIDFSEVPSDILPLIVSLIARVIFPFSSGRPLIRGIRLQFSVMKLIFISRQILKRV